MIRKMNADVGAREASINANELSFQNLNNLF